MDYETNSVEKGFGKEAAGGGLGEENLSGEGADGFGSTGFREGDYSKGYGTSSGAESNCKGAFGEGYGEPSFGGDGPEGVGKEGLRKEDYGTGYCTGPDGGKAGSGEGVGGFVGTAVSYSSDALADTASNLRHEKLGEAVPHNQAMGMLV